uniref:Nondiscriminating glutamyl-tRNA synthetase EARS2, mitochondrial n=1 Tax=Haemonchus contortus TaxID=6289 RepID=A0A7I4YDJ0_HAECO
MVALLWRRWFSSVGGEVRVRFAPSPTGHLHLGSLRTALYNFLFARHHKGSFILRIEDTDRARIVPGSVSSIERILDHYDLHYDEGPQKGGNYGPYQQSERLPLYRDAVDQLIDSGHAYRCFCSEERLALLRKDAARRGETPKYDRRCRTIEEGESRARVDAGEPFVVRLKLDKQDVSFEDEIFGPIDQCIDESDMVLLKSDGFPTYHLANIVDDRAMHISHVIRGMEWLSSTGKHVLLYKAFGWPAPKWLHLPLITRDGKKKLSKRDKDAFVDYYEQELGALPSAVLNLLIRNGSGIRDFNTAHLYSLNEMIANFDEHCIGKRNLQLDQEALDRYGRMAFQMSDFETELLPAIIRLIKRDLPHVQVPDVDHLRKVVDFLKANEESFAFLSSLTKGDFQWLLMKPTSAERVLTVFDRETALEFLTYLRECESLDLDGLKRSAEHHGWQYTKLLALIRVSLIDSTKGPPIKELVSFFGVEECRKRFRDLIDYIHSHSASSVMNK